MGWASNVAKSFASDYRSNDFPLTTRNSSPSTEDLTKTPHSTELSF